MNPTWIHVAAVYLIAVWLGRRAGAPLPWRIAGMFYALTLLFLFAPMTGPWVSFPADFLHILPPWGTVRHLVRIGNGALNDLTLQMVPWAHQVRESWFDFQVPLWNSRSGSGYPLLGNGQSSALSLLRILCLPLSLAHSITAEAALKILTALTFTYLICRRRGWCELACCVAAVSYGFSAFMVIWLHFPHVTVASLLPAAVYALELLMERPSAKRVLFGASVWAAILFGGHPETAAHIFVLSLLWLGWLVFGERRFRPREALRAVLQAGGVMALAALLAAPFLVAMAEAIPRSLRYHQLRDSASAHHKLSDPMMFVVLLRPYLYGGGDNRVEVLQGAAHAEVSTGFAGILGPVAVIALLVHAILTRRFRTFETFLSLSAIAVLGNVLDWPVLGRAVETILPVAANNRIRLLLGFLLALAAGAAVQMIASHPAPGWRERAAFLTGVAALAAGVVAAFLAGAGAVGGAAGAPLVRGDLLSALAMPILVLSVAAFLPAKRMPTGLSVALMTAVAAEMFSTLGWWNTPVSQHRVYPRTELVRKLEALAAATPPERPFRIVGIGPALFSNVSAVYGLDDIRVHDPMANARYARLLGNLARYDVENYFAHWTDTETRLLDFLNVRFMIDRKERPELDPSRWKLLYSSREGAIYENLDVYPRFFPIRNVIFYDGDIVPRLRGQEDWRNTAFVRWLPAATERERHDLLAARPPTAPETKLEIVAASGSEYRMRVEAPRHSLVASSIAWWPGWRISADGRQLSPVRINEAFLGFVVPPGVHQVRVRFAPVPFALAAAASLLTFSVLVVLSSQRLRTLVRRIRR